MKKDHSLKRDVVQIVLSVFVTALTGVQRIGQPLRTVHLIILIAGGIAAGVAVGRLVERKRVERVIVSREEE